MTKRPIHRMSNVTHKPQNMTGKPKISLLFSIPSIISVRSEAADFPGVLGEWTTMAMKKGPTKGSGGKHRNSLRGKGPTPKAEDRVYHKAYKEKQATNRRKMADPRLAARRRAAKFSSESDDLVIGRNAVLEALRCGVPASTLYVAARIEHDDRTREIIRLAGIHGLNLMEADRLEMDRIARSSNHQEIGRAHV